MTPRLIQGLLNSNFAIQLTLLKISTSITTCSRCYLSLSIGVSTKLLRAFSVFTNAPAVISSETKQDDIPCLYGIRFISMLWVMLGNTYIYVALSLSETPVAGINVLSSLNFVLDSRLYMEPSFAVIM